MARCIALGGPGWLVNAAHDVLTDLDRVISLRAPNEMAVAVVRVQAKTILAVWREYREG